MPQRDVLINQHTSVTYDTHFIFCDAWHQIHNTKSDHNNTLHSNDFSIKNKFNSRNTSFIRRPQLALQMFSSYWNSRPK